MTEVPTSDRTIAVTHEVEPDDQLLSELARNGIQPLLWPTVRTVATDSRPIRSTLSKAHDVTWLIVTSRRAVDAVVACGARPPGHLRIGTVGPRTTAAAEAAGWRVTLTSPGPGSDRLAADLSEQLKGGERILYFAGDLASSSLQSRLTEAGAIVDRVTVYRTEGLRVDEEPWGSCLSRGNVAAVTFLSPSAARNLARSMDQLALGLKLRATPAVAIGPETARALDDLGFEEVHQSVAPSKTSVASCALDLLEGSHATFT